MTEVNPPAVMREFSRWCALSTKHLWHMPEVTRLYLETGDEGMRGRAAAASYKAADESYRERNRVGTTHRGIALTVLDRAHQAAFFATCRYMGLNAAEGAARHSRAATATHAAFSTGAYDPDAESAEWDRMVAAQTASLRLIAGKHGYDGVSAEIDAMANPRFYGNTRRIAQ